MKKLSLKLNNTNVEVKKFVNIGSTKSVLKDGRTVLRPIYTYKN